MPITKFPQSGGGTDFQKKTPQFVANYADSPSDVTLLNVLGKGILVDIAQVASSSPAQGKVTIILDGVTVLNNVEIAHASYNRNLSMNLLYKFEQSCVIKHNVVSGTVLTLASYLLD